MIGANEPPIFSPFRIVITFVSLTQNFFQENYSNYRNCDDLRLCWYLVVYFTRV